MPLKVQNKLNFLYVISGWFFFLFCSPSPPERHVSIISSKCLIAPVCVRGWKPLSVLPLRNRRLSSIKPWISQDLWCIWEKKDTQSILGLCGPPISSQSNTVFLERRDSQSRRGSYPRFMQQEGFDRNRAQFPGCYTWWCFLLLPPALTLQDLQSYSSIWKLWIGTNVLQEPFVL